MTEVSNYYVAVFPSGQFDRFDGPFKTEEDALCRQGKVFDEAEESSHDIVYCFVVPSEKERYLRWCNDDHSDLDTGWDDLVGHLEQFKEKEVV